MTDSVPERKCPKCGKTDVVAKSGSTAFHPRIIAAGRILRRDRKVVERNFRCRDCGHKFAEVEEHEL
jgi:phage FluMu protein Com